MTAVSEKLLKWLNRCLNAAVILVIVAAMVYSLYSIWDNNSIYQAALDISQRILREKPNDDQPSFDELQKINPDVCAWLTMNGTRIDGPIVQGENNEEYLNKDVYGEYSLAGTLFLDTRCSRDFGDFSGLVYGHHMEKHAMFGDLDLYLEREFFNQNTTGTLLIPDKKISLHVLAVQVVSDWDSWIFDPASADADPSGFLDYIESNAKYIHSSVLKRVKKNLDKYHILVLSTCSSHQEDDRTVVLAAYQFSDTE